MIAPPNKAIKLVLRHVDERSTGEIVAADTDMEAHVFLQRGRLAWAYTSLQRGTFLRMLQQRTSLDEEGLREVLGECRRTKRHLAETLVAWGLATERDVRQALWAQMHEALRSIAAAPEPEALFLPRSESLYDERLTFCIDEFERDTFTTPPPPGEPSAQQEAADQELSNQVQQALSGALSVMWTRLVRPGRRSSGDLRLQLAAEAALSLGASEVCWRCPRGWMLAVPHSEGLLLCGLSPDALVTRARTALLRELHAEPEPEPAALPLGPPLPASGPDELAWLRALVQGYDRLAGAALLSTGRRLVLREGAPRGLDGWLSRASPLLSLPVDDLLPSGKLAPNHSQGVRVVLPGLHLLGAPLPDGTSLWLAVCPTVIEGFGWGLLSNALRQLQAT